MKVIRARVLGFCMGVRRAVESAFKTLDEHERDDLKVFTFGHLIHNPFVLNALEKRGVEVVFSDSLDKVEPGSIVIICAHGASPSIINALKAKGAKVLDMTCPIVQQNQKRAAEWDEKGFSVIIAGDKNHAEVKGISGFAGKNALIVESACEAEKLDVPKKSVLVSQATFSAQEFDRIAETLRKKNPSLSVFNSICPSTIKRQAALKELASQTEGILVIGGRESANTKRLFELASSLSKKASLIENALEIPNEFLSLKTVGLTAGASTPDTVIDEVESFLLGAKNNL